MDKDLRDSLLKEFIIKKKEFSQGEAIEFVRENWDHPGPVPSFFERSMSQILRRFPLSREEISQNYYKYRVSGNWIPALAK